MEIMAKHATYKNGKGCSPVSPRSRCSRHIELGHSTRLSLMEHQDYQQLLIPHSLDALEVSEARELEAHLETCAECRAEFVALRDDAALLAYTAEPAEPRPEVRARILEGVRSPQIVDRAGAVMTDKVVTMRPRANWNVWTMGLRVAAGLAFIALLTGLVVLWRRDVKLQQEVAQLNRQLNTQQHELV